MHAEATYDKVRYFSPELPVIVMTASQEIETAVACMKEGAFDYLVKPVEESRFVSSVKRALEMCALRRQVGALKRSLMTDRLEHGDAFAGIVTLSRKMRSLFQYLEAIAGSREPVPIRRARAWSRVPPAAPCSSTRSVT